MPVPAWLPGRAALEVIDRANRRLCVSVSGAGGALRVTIDVDDGDVRPPDGWRSVVEHPGVTIAERV